MDTRHISKAEILSAQAIREAGLFEFFEGESWMIKFKVSDKFAIAFVRHMKAKLHEQFVYKGEIGEHVTCTVLGDAHLYGFHDEDLSWGFSDEGDLMMQVDYDDLIEQEIPVDAWVRPVSTLRAVLDSMI